MHLESYDHFEEHAREEGRAEGIAEGRAEIAKNLLDKNVDMDIIESVKKLTKYRFFLFYNIKKITCMAA